MASRLFLYLFFVTVCFLSPISGWCQSSAEPFTIRGVDVDVTATSANQAKDQAIGVGQRKAFQLLLERLTKPQDRARLPKVDGADYVSDYAIEDERSSSVRYLATLSVRFNAVAVRKLLNGAGIVVTEPVVHTVVVIPVFRMAGQTLIWEDSNPWRLAWITHGKGGLVALTIPAAEDGMLPTADQIVAGEDAALSSLANRYHTSDVLTLTVDLSGDGHKAELISASARGASIFLDNQSFVIKPGESQSQFLSRIVREVMGSIEAQTRMNAVQAGQAQDTLSVIAPLSSLAEWVSIRDRLSRGGVIRSWDLVSLTRTEAAVVLHLSGDADKAKTALAVMGLDLQAAEGYWLLKSLQNKR